MEKNREYMFGIKKIEKYEGENYLINNYLRIWLIIINFLKLFNGNCLNRNINNFILQVH